GHVERLSDIGAAATDEGASGPLSGLPGDGSEACERSCLAVFERAEFGHVDDEREGGDDRDAGDRDEDIEAAGKVGVSSDERPDLGLDRRHLTSDLPELLSIVTPEDGKGQVLCP